MSAKMLLRSRSTPLLSSLTGLHLVSPSLHSPTAREAEREKSSAESPRPASRLSRSVSFTNAALASAATSPIPQHVCVPDDARSLDGLEWGYSGEGVPWPRFKKVQSDGDLESLARGSSSALTAAAESLVLPTSRNRNGEVQDVFDGEKLSTVGRQWSRRLSIRRQPSLSVIPSNSDNSGSDSDDIQEARSLIEAPDLVGTDNTGTQVSENGAKILDYSSTANCVQYPRDEALHGPQYHTQMPNLTNAQDPCRGHDDAGAPDVLESEFLMASEATKGYPAKIASAAGRERTGYYGAGDGGMHSSVSAGSNGAVLVCNSRGQSDVLGPMFIAGGFGIGGGGGGGRNCNVATGGGGGRGDSLGTDAYYKRALEANPGHPLLLRNYAKFLHEVKRDTAEAESFYERAILANPGDGEVLGLYAKLIWDVYEDEERAGSYFEQAVQASPDNCYVAAAHASFLWALDGVEENLVDSGLCSALGAGVTPRYSSVTAS